MDASGPGELSIFLILCGILGMLLLAVGVVIFVLLNQKKTLIHQQRLQDLEIDHREELLNAAIQSQERERSRVARDLHDGVGSILSATKLFVHQLNGERAGQDYKALHQETRNALDEAIDNVRAISRDLLPSSLSESGLNASLKDLCSRIELGQDLQTDFYSNREVLLDAEIELAIFRITQELINNTIKYAEASKIRISLKIDGETFTYQYVDDGKGFDQSQLSTRGLGLGSIESRILFIGARSELMTSPGNGFRYKFILPISE